MKLMRPIQGFSLIEILVSVLILGTGILTISAMQLRSLQQNHDSFVRTQANIVAYDVMERVRAISDAPPGPITQLTNAQVDEIVSVLPDGDGSLACVQRLCTVTVTWSEARGSNPDGVTSTFTYTTSL